MPKKSIKEDKSIYQIKREELGLTRAQAEDLMTSVSEDRLEKLENGRTRITPYDVLQMSEAYGCPELCNHYCKNDCDIGEQRDYVLEVDDLPEIVLELVAKLNEIGPMVNRLIDITYDGDISDDEKNDFAHIRETLKNVKLQAEELDLWVEKTIK